MPIIAGRDSLGNKYYEIVKYGTREMVRTTKFNIEGRMRRWVKMAGVSSHNDYDPEKIPGKLQIMSHSTVLRLAEWRGWLVQTRKEPPT